MSFFMNRLFPIMILSNLMATGSIVNPLVESASGADVKHSIIHGRLVMKYRQLLTIDEEKVLAEAKAVMGGHGFFAKQGAYCG